MSNYTGHDWLGPTRRQKGPEGLVKKNKQGKIVEKVDAEKSTIAGAGADTTWVNDPYPPHQNDQNNDGVS